MCVVYNTASFFASLAFVDDVFVHVNFRRTLSCPDRLPYSIRVVLESTVRNCDNFQFRPKDVANILDWETNQEANVEIPFRPGRVILQDFT